MTARIAGLPAPLVDTSKLALGLAVCTSAAVGVAAMTGPGLTTPEVVGALALAGTIGVLSTHGSRPQAQPHVLVAVPESEAGVRVAAPKARTLTAHPAHQQHSDAA